MIEKREAIKIAVSAVQSVHSEVIKVKDCEHGSVSESIKKLEHMILQKTPPCKSRDESLERLNASKAKWSVVMFLYRREDMSSINKIIVCDIDDMTGAAKISLFEREWEHFAS